MAGQPKRRIRPVPVVGRTFLEWIPFWENELGARGARPRTIVNQREQLQRLARHFGDVDAASVTDWQLLAWRDSLVKRGLKATTINTYNLTVSTFYNWLADEGIISESPMLYVPLLPVVEYAPPAAIDAAALRGLAKGAGSRRSGRSAFEATRDPAMLALLQDTGLRASECAGLLSEHVDIGARQAFVHGAIAKGGYERTVTFGFQTARLLNRYAIARGSHRFAFLPQLFVGRGGAASYKTVAGVIARPRKRLASRARGAPLPAYVGARPQIERRRARSAYVARRLAHDRNADALWTCGKDSASDCRLRADGLARRPSTTVGPLLR